jgi:uncharacterized repeat protein (TIGR01451 family)
MFDTRPKFVPLPGDVWEKNRRSVASHLTGCSSIRSWLCQLATCFDIGKNQANFLSKWRWLAGLFILPFFSNLKAEGTKELAPDSTDVVMLYTIDNTYGNFAAYNGLETGRLYFRIGDPENEQVFVGLSRQASTTNGTDGNLLNTAYYFRIKDPNGNVVYGPQIVNSTTANADTWALAAAGPAPVVGASGYTPFTFDPSGLSPGDYYIEFSGNATTATTSLISIKFWDITVATTDATPTALPGRLWSKRWSLRTPSISQGADPTYTYYDRPFNGQVFLYTSDGFVSKVDFYNSGFRGLSFNLAYNETGVATTGDFEADRRSVENSNNTLPQYKIFINEPDIDYYASGVIGSITSPPVLIDCNPSALCISYAVDQPGYIFVLLDFNPASGAGKYDPGTSDVLLYQKVSAAAGEAPSYERCISWDGQNGLGATVDLNSEVPIYLSYVQGLVHFPVYDVEFNPTGFNVTPIRPLLPGFSQKVYYDDVNIPDTSGNGSLKVMVNGCTPPCHSYSNFGYGDLNTINSWWYTSQDVEITSALATCLLKAYNDFDETTEETPVIIDVLGNDYGNSIDPSTVSNTGLLAPNHGAISINGVTGEITYTPVAGFIGLDSFEYVICESGGSPCDTAMVYVTVSCGTVVSNGASGVVFLDNNDNGIRETGEPGKANVTVSLFLDNDEDGLLDAGDTKIDSINTDSNGKYAFTLTPTFSSTATYEDVPPAGIAFNESSYPCSNPLSRTYNVAESLTITDVNFGFNASHTYRGDIRVTLISPSGTSVIIINNGGDSRDNYDLILDSSSGNPLNDGSNDNVASPYYDRIAAPSNSLNAFNGQNSAGTWTVRICDNVSGDNGTYYRSQLVVTGVDPTGIHYIITMDSTDLPVVAEMTTDNLETAVFSTIGVNDCANNFGYIRRADLSLDKSVSNASPTVGGAIVYTLTVSNAGPNAADSVEVTDLLPAGLTYVSDNSGGNYNPATGLWEVGSVAAGGSVSLQITTTVSDDGPMTNAAEITNSTLPDPDSTPDNGELAEDDRDSVCLTVRIPFCVGTTYSLSARSGLTGYQWYRNGAIISGATTQVYSLTSLSGASDTLTYSAVTSAGDPFTETCPFVFFQTNTAVVAGSNSPVCEGGNIALTESGGTAVSWTWTGPAGFSAASQNPVRTNASVSYSGAYTVTATDAYGCTAVANVNVTVNEQLIAGTAIANDTLCLEGSGMSLLNLFDKLVGEDAGGVWSVVSGSPGAHFNAAAGTVNPNALPIGSYTFRYTVTSASPCTSDTEDWTVVVRRCCPPSICLPLTTVRN